MKENTLKFAKNPPEFEAYADTLVSEIDTLGEILKLLKFD